jgi:hypothetical protein
LNFKMMCIWIKMLIVISDLEVSFKIDMSVKPIKQRLRRVPKALEEKVDDDVEKLLSENIIERVDDAE